MDEAYIWPEILSAPATQSASVTELLELQPSRAAVPHAVWSQLIAGAREALDVLTYAGTFLFEQHNFVDVLRESPPQVSAVDSSSATRPHLRSTDELRRRALHRRYLREVAGLPGVEIRTHATTLYNTLFRFDQDLMSTVIPTRRLLDTRPSYTCAGPRLGRGVVSQKILSINGGSWVAAGPWRHRAVRVPSPRPRSPLGYRVGRRGCRCGR